MTTKLTLAEAARWLRRSPRTIYTWTSRKAIPHLKIGGRLLFDSEELEEWMARFKVGPSQKHPGA